MSTPPSTEDSVRALAQLMGVDVVYEKGSPAMVCRLIAAKGYAFTPRFTQAIYASTWERALEKLQGVVPC